MKTKFIIGTILFIIGTIMCLTEGQNGEPTLINFLGLLPIAATAFLATGDKTRTE